MEYIYKEIGARAGAILEVALDRQANVHLFDPTNYSRGTIGHSVRIIN